LKSRSKPTSRPTRCAIAAANELGQLKNGERQQRIDEPECLFDGQDA
jgi:hypothetical protein